MAGVSTNPTPRSAPARSRATTLSCPICGKAVRVTAGKLVEGRTVRCPSCRSDAELTHELDDATGRMRWSLIDPSIAPDGAGA